MVRDGLTFFVPLVTLGLIAVVLAAFWPWVGIPALIIVLLAIAQQVAGFGGMLVAVPLAAVSRDLFKYIYSRLQERENELANERAIRLPRPPKPSIPENGATDQGPVEPAHTDGVEPAASDAAGVRPQTSTD